MTINLAVEINATPEKIWQVLADASKITDWACTDGQYPYPVEVNIEQRGNSTLWAVIASDGQTAVFRITDWQPARSLAYELVQHTNAPMQMAQWNIFEIEGTAEGSVLIWQFNWQIEATLVQSFLLRSDAVREYMERSLENFRQLLSKSEDE